MVLHTLNAAPGSVAFDDCLRLACAGDTILLLGNGVYAALPGSQAASRLQQCDADVLLLRDDAIAAGSAIASDLFTAVDMAGFVELSERYPRQLAWY
jgi:tRNA 2-thiouridine synthesizing protein B